MLRDQLDSLTTCKAASFMSILCIVFTPWEIRVMVRIKIFWFTQLHNTWNWRTPSIPSWYPETDYRAFSRKFLLAKLTFGTNCCQRYFETGTTKDPSRRELIHKEIIHTYDDRLPLDKSLHTFYSRIDSDASAYSWCIRRMLQIVHSPINLFQSVK